MNKREMGLERPDITTSESGPDKNKERGLSLLESSLRELDYVIENARLIKQKAEEHNNADTLPEGMNMEEYYQITRKMAEDSQAMVRKIYEIKGKPYRKPELKEQ